MPPSSRILLVDDEESVLELVRETLEGCGYIIETATNSSEALAKLKTCSFSMNTRATVRLRASRWRTDTRGFSFVSRTTTGVARPASLLFLP